MEEILQLLRDPQAWMALITLVVMEVVLGIDNLIFISILSNKLPAEQRDKARRLGLALALVTRILLLCSLSWVMSLSNRLWEVSIGGLPLPNTGKDLVLAVGGLFLIWKSVKEVHEKLEDADGHATAGKTGITFAGVIAQILILDIVFSLDSVITAVGMANHIGVMITAVVIALGVMLVFAGSISDFVNRHPTLTRASYPLPYIRNHVPSGRGGHPKNVVFLTADAFGVLPPISQLSPEQAMYHFLSGYTARVAGTEAGVTEPQPNFSVCFGAPFMPRPPMVYATMLADRIKKHGSDVWLLNTGWTGGPYGVGSRFKLAYTRAMVNAIHDGSLKSVKTVEHPVFGLHMPVAVPGVPAEVLDPRNTWKDKAAYDAKAKELAAKFRENDRKFSITDAVRNAGPKA